MRIESLGPGAGEVAGLDAAARLSDATVSDLRAAFVAFPVLVLRDQRLTPPELAAFAGHFGTLERYAAPPPGVAPPTAALRQSDARSTPDQRLYPCPEDPCVLLMTNEWRTDRPPLAVVDNAETWHADGSHKATPYDAVALHVVKNPADGGDTEFCDLSALYEALPENVKLGLDGRYGAHHWSKSRNPRFAAWLDAAAFAEGERVAAAFPEARQPVVCWDEAARRAHLFLSPRFTLRIDGLPAELSRLLLDNLFALMDEPQFVYRHVWREGDLLLWDNRRTNHRVRAYAADDVRSRYRVTVTGRGPMRPALRAA